MEQYLTHLKSQTQLFESQVIPEIQTHCQRQKDELQKYADIFKIQHERLVFLKEAMLQKQQHFSSACQKSLLVIYDNLERSDTSSKQAVAIEKEAQQQAEHVYKEVFVL